MFCCSACLADDDWKMNNQLPRRRHHQHPLPVPPRFKAKFFPLLLRKTFWCNHYYFDLNSGMSGMLGDLSYLHFSWVIPDVIGGCARPDSELQLKKFVEMGITLLITLAADQPPPNSIENIKELRWHFALLDN